MNTRKNHFINSGLNTSDESDILDFIIDIIIKNKDAYSIDTRLCILINKCDDMMIENDTLSINDEELREIFIQANNIIQTRIGNIDEKYGLAKTPILPIYCIVYFDQNRFLLDQNNYDLTFYKKLY